MAKSKFDASYIISVILTFIVCGFTIFASFAQYITPLHSINIAILGILSPYLIALNILFFLFWCIKLKGWVIIPIIAILFNWNYITSIVQYNSIASNESDIKIATYNLETNSPGLANQLRQNGTITQLNKTGVEILCTQFSILSDTIPTSIKKLWKYNSISENSRGIKLMTLSQYPIISSESYISTSGRNNILLCDMVKGNDTIRVINFHTQSLFYEQSTDFEFLSLPTEIKDDIIERTNQANKINKLVSRSNLPTILCGTLNDRPSSYSYHLITERLKDGFKKGANGYDITYNSILFPSRIDYIFTGNRVNTSKYYSLKNTTGKHFPTIIELSIQ